MATESRLASQASRAAKRVADGEYYEALQLYKTLAARHRSGGRAAAAAELLAAGVRELTGHGQVPAAIELATLLVELYESQAGTEEGKQQHGARCPQVIELMRLLMDASGEAQASTRALLRSCVRRALSWDRKNGEYQLGHPDLHVVAADLCLRSDDFGGAQQHLVAGGAAMRLASLLVEWVARGYPSERDLFVARAVLLFLANGDLSNANLIFAAAKGGIQPWPETPLIHFVQFLLTALQRDALPLFQMLRNKYAKALERDESFDAMLDQVANKFFDVPVSGGLIQDLLQDLLTS